MLNRWIENVEREIAFEIHFSTALSVYLPKKVLIKKRNWYYRITS